MCFESTNQFFLVPAISGGGTRSGIAGSGHVDIYLLIRNFQPLFDMDFTALDTDFTQTPDLLDDWWV